jgi:hypothetical protein
MSVHTTDPRVRRSGTSWVSNDDRFVFCQPASLHDPSFGVWRNDDSWGPPLKSGFTTLDEAVAWALDGAR